MIAKQTGKGTVRCSITKPLVASSVLCGGGGKGEKTKRERGQVGGVRFCGRAAPKGSVSLKGGKRGKHADAEIAVVGEVDVHEGKRGKEHGGFGLGRFRTVSVTCRSDSAARKASTVMPTHTLLARTAKPTCRSMAASMAVMLRK